MPGSELMLGLHGGVFNKSLMYMYLFQYTYSKLQI